MKITKHNALYRLIYYSKSAVHVSGDVFARHQEHLTVFIVSGSVHPKLLPIGLLGELKLHNVFAHHQEHLTVFTVSGSVHPSCCLMVSWMS
jgi:hypothetical protein